MYSGHSLRMALPLGLNKCPPFHSISSKSVADTLLPLPETAVEVEMRRNLFWLAYATDRGSSMGTPWAFGIEDDDIGQLLPVRGDLFDIGVRLHPCRLPLLRCNSF
jgi:Fungal specific transcription factor domain